MSNLHEVWSNASTRKSLPCTFHYLHSSDAARPTQIACRPAGLSCDLSIFRRHHPGLGVKPVRGHIEQPVRGHCEQTRAGLKWTICSIIVPVETSQYTASKSAPGNWNQRALKTRKPSSYFAPLKCGIKNEIENSKSESKSKSKLLKQSAL